jgi:hypothetical protein
MKWFWIVGAALLLAACSRDGPKLGSQPYAGPPLSIESTPPRHTIILTAPSAGWSLSLDRATRGFDRTDVFITIRRPDPAYMHAQVVSTHRLDSSVDSSTPIRLLARILEAQERPLRQPFNPVQQPTP